jgi:O-acetyl-ADP-ribose deacetylase (regulator of RNase III)
MEIKYRHGNLLTAEERVIIHGCNAQGVMGSGVAYFLREKYPKAYEDYHAEYRANGQHLPLGSIVWSAQDTHEQHLIGNAITQEYAGREPNRRYVSYDAIAEAMDSIDSLAHSGAFDKVAMPLIGAGLAQGRWPIIKSIIETHSQHFQPVVYLIDGVIPK